MAIPRPDAGNADICRNDPIMASRFATRNDELFLAAEQPNGGGVAIVAAIFIGVGVIDLGALAFAGREEQIALYTVLPRVQVVVAAAEVIQRLMSAALDDVASFDHQNLFGSPNC